MSIAVKSQSPQRRWDLSIWRSEMRTKWQRISGDAGPPRRFGPTRFMPVALLAVSDGTQADAGLTGERIAKFSPKLGNVLGQLSNQLRMLGGYIY